MRSPHIIITTIIIMMMTIRPRHLVSPTLRSGGRGGRALAGLSPPPRPPLHLFRSPSPTHGLIRITPRHLPPSYRPRNQEWSGRVKDTREKMNKLYDENREFLENMKKRQEQKVNDLLEDNKELLESIKKKAADTKEV